MDDSLDFILYIFVPVVVCWTNVQSGACNKTVIKFYRVEFSGILKWSIRLSNHDFQANLIICKRLNVSAGLIGILLKILILNNALALIKKLVILC